MFELTSKSRSDGKLSTHVLSLQLLLDNGAPVDVFNYLARTPLMTAVCNDNTSCARLLLLAGASLEVTFSSGKTMHENAIETGFGDIAELLETIGEKRRKG